MSKNKKIEEKNPIEVAQYDKVFASCTFETLGLHPRLCNILQGTISNTLLVFYICLYTKIVIVCVLLCMYNAVIWVFFL